jgi:hypothetical protein
MLHVADVITAASPYGEREHRLHIQAPDPKKREER